MVNVYTVPDLMSERMSDRFLVKRITGNIVAW